MTSWDEVKKRLTELSVSSASFRRLAASNALAAYINEPAAISLLRRLSQDEDPAVRDTSLALLGEVPPEATSDKGRSRNLSVAKSISLNLGDTNTVERSEAPLELLSITGSEPNIEFPIPQANSLDVICHLLAESQIQHRSIRDCLSLSDLSHRQWDYYENAIGFLKLTDFRFSTPESVFEEGIIALSDFVHFVGVLLANHEVLRRIIQARILSAELEFLHPSKEMLRIWVSQLGLPAFSEDTLLRRGNSLDAWAKWISFRLDKLETYDDGAKTTVPEPINVAPMIFAFLGVLEEGKKSSPQRGRKKRANQGQTRIIYTETDFARVKRRLTRFRHSGGITLEEEGATSGITRERVRQIENKFSKLLEFVVETDGVEAIRAVNECLKEQMPVSLGNWALNSLRLTVREEVIPTPSRGAASSLPYDLASVDFDDWAVQETLIEHFGPEPVELLPGSSHGAVGLAVMVLRSALLQQRMETSRTTNDLWVEAGRLDDPELRSLGRVKSEQDRKRAKRIEGIMQELEKEQLSAPDLAKRLGEANPNALAEFMRRQPQLVVKRGLWSIKDANHVDDQFSSAYNALIHVLESFGPATTRELSERLEKVHPMTISRLQQAMDDRRVGRMTDGRVGLISQGASRKNEKEPKIPPRLIVHDEVADLILTASKDHLRGSGFQVPSWLGWRFGLTATPDSVTLTSIRGENLTLTRRGGQIFSASIRSFLVESAIQEGCSFELSVNLASLKFEIRHLCRVH